MHSIDGLNTPDDLAKFAKKTGAGAIAVTDHGNVAAHIAFWKACKKEGVKPILGCEFYLIPDAKTQKDQGFGRGKSFHITVLAQNETGWHNMMRLVSISNSPEFFHYEPRIDWGSLVANKEGLIILSGCPKGLVSKPFREGDESLATQRAGLMVKEFGDNLYFEVQDIGCRDLDCDQAKINAFMRKMAKLYGRPTVYTMDAHFSKKEDHEAHLHLIGIMTARHINEVKESYSDYAGELYLKTSEECLQFDCTPQEIDETQRIAERIEEFEVGVGGRHLPTISNDSNDTPIEQLRQLALEGWKKFDISSRPNKDEYAARMKKELADIEQAGMAEYFLLVHDVVSWGKARGIPFGSGRGSAGGSLTLYLLGVTGKDLDPIEWGLVWERFYNVGRSHSFPDVDIDVAKEYREDVIQYIAERFGDDRVSQLITFGRMTARSVLKDVMRTQGVPFDEANRVTGLIPPKNDDHATDISLKEAFDINPQLAAAEKLYPKVFEIARKLEGKYRGYGVHAAAVIINDVSFDTGNLPLVRDKSGKKLICGWSMEEVDELGYLKLDILGLNELDIIHHALGLVKERHGVDIDFEGFPQGNKRAFQMLADGRTEGIFQMRSNLGRTWCKSIAPTNVEEISAIAALIRPACLDAGMTRRYARIKHGEEEEAYIHDDLKPVLGPTHSVYVYQEQALQMCAMVGMTLSEADIVRKAIGKKKPELLAKQEARFIELAKQNGYEDIAEQLWNYIKEGAGYGFNKSHSVAYSLLSYKNAFLKANYPAEFYCANMIKCANLGDKQKSLERIKELINDAKIAGIRVTPPSVTVCNMDFEITSESSIAFGLSHIHGVGIGGLRTVQKCSAATDFYHFVRLANEHRVNRRVMEGLIRSGACDVFGMPRKQMELEYETIQDLPKREREHAFANIATDGLVPLIEAMGDEDTVDDRKSKKEFVPNKNRRAKLRVLYEKLYQESVFSDDKEWNLQNEHKYLGCPLSGNFEDIFTSLPNTGHNCLDTLSMENDERFQLCVQIDDVRVVHTKKDRKPMAFLSVSDRSYGLKDVVVFPKTYSKYGELLVPNSIVRLWCFYNDGVKAWKIQQISKVKSESF